MKRAVCGLLLAVAFLFFITTTSVADTKIMSQNAEYCKNGEAISEEVRQGERVEASIRILVTDEQELSLFSELNDVTFYLEEQKISDNSSVNLILPPGTHNLRVIGLVKDIAEDGEEITLLGSYSLGKYITAKISSPYILKDTAYSYVIVSGFLCTIITSLIVFFITKGKLHRMKSSVDKISLEHRKRVRENLIVFVKDIAPNLNADQKKEAKELLRKLDEA